MSEEIITETQVPDIAALVEFIAKSLVDEPSEVKVAVKADEAGEETTIELSVAKDDMGKVIGKQGRIAKAIRTVVRAASVKSEKKYRVRYSVTVPELTSFVYGLFSYRAVSAPARHQG